jgi:hypothetical protein
MLQHPSPDDPVMILMLFHKFENEKFDEEVNISCYGYLLNPLLTSFFSKAFGVLITRLPEQVSKDVVKLLKIAWVKLNSMHYKLRVGVWTVLLIRTR